MNKMHSRVKEKPLDADTLAIETSDEQPGLQSKLVFETIEEISAEADTIAELMLKWRKSKLNVSVSLATWLIGGSSDHRNFEYQLGLRRGLGRRVPEQCRKAGASVCLPRIPVPRPVSRCTFFLIRH